MSPFERLGSIARDFFTRPQEPLTTQQRVIKKFVYSASATAGAAFIVLQAEAHKPRMIPLDEILKNPKAYQGIVIATEGYIMHAPNRHIIRAQSWEPYAEIAFTTPLYTHPSPETPSLPLEETIHAQAWNMYDTAPQPLPKPVRIRVEGVVSPDYQTSTNPTYTFFIREKEIVKEKREK